MSTHSIDESTIPTPEPSANVKGNAIHGILIGMIPLGLLACIVCVVLVTTLLARTLTATGGFFVQQETALITLIVGLVLAIVVFAIACWRVLRRVATWQQRGITLQANAALWALGATAFVVVIPILVAILLPQHPFP